MASDDSLEDFADTDNKPKENPFDDKPKFDAGVETDEESNPKKFIEQLTGKLGQSLRAYTDENGQIDSDLEKYVINSVISATHPDKMDAEDLKDINEKLNSTEPNDDGDVDNGDAEGSNDNEPNFDDNIEENFILDKEHKQVFKDEKLGLNESKNRNIEKYLVSLVNTKLKPKKMELETKMDQPKPTETPVKPIVQPIQTPNRRSMPYKPRVTPLVNPEPKQQK